MNTVKRIINIVTTIVIIITVLLVVMLAAVRIVGLTPYTVLSGSMEPTYHVGSIIYVKDIEPQELKERDPVTYTLDGGTVVTHRIIEVIEEENDNELSFRTKGDANESVDGGLLTASNVIGKPVFSIPFLGYIANAIQTPRGIIGTAGLCIMMVLINIIVDILESLKKEEDKPID